jgi:transcriptional regulator with XRE-family HTH domain
MDEEGHRRCAMTGAQLKAIRQELQWTRERLARFLGVSPVCLAQLERGTRPIDDRTARIMRLLYIIYRLVSAVRLLAR